MFVRFLECETVVVRKPEAASCLRIGALDVEGLEEVFGK
jgi:hypothetical protein